MTLGDPYAVVGTGTSAGITTEAVLVTTPVQPATAEGGQGNLLLGNVSVPAIAATATIRVRIRQNSLTGTIVFDTGSNLTVGTAATGLSLPVFALDSSAASAGVSQYVLTVTSSASGAATGILAVVPAGLSG